MRSQGGELKLPTSQRGYARRNTDLILLELQRNGSSKL
jgi:hypothetical protein